MPRDYKPEDCHYYEPKIGDFESCPVTVHASDALTPHCIGCRYNTFSDTATKIKLSDNWDRRYKYT